MPVEAVLRGSVQLRCCVANSPAVLAVMPVPFGILQDNLV